MNISACVLLFASASIATAGPMLSAFNSAFIELHVPDELRPWDVQCYGGQELEGCTHNEELGDHDGNFLVTEAPPSAMMSLELRDQDGNIYFTNTATVAMQASAEFGELRSSGDLEGFTDSYLLQSRASFTDQLTVFGPTSGFIRYHIRGNVVAPGEPTAGSSLTSSYFGITHGNQPDEGMSFWNGTHEPGFQYVSALYPFQHGIPIDLSLMLNVYSWDAAPGAMQTWRILLQLHKIELLDQNRQPAYGEIVSAAGAPYAVPEPGSVLLIASGVALMCLRRRLGLICSEPK
jgi:hypothetical protein